MNEFIRSITKQEALSKFDKIYENYKNKTPNMSGFFHLNCFAKRARD